MAEPGAIQQGPQASGASFISSTGPQEGIGPVMIDTLNLDGAQSALQVPHEHKLVDKQYKERGQTTQLGDA